MIEKYIHVLAKQGGHLPDDMLAHLTTCAVTIWRGGGEAKGLLGNLYRWELQALRPHISTEKLQFLFQFQSGALAVGNNKIYGVEGATEVGHQIDCNEKRKTCHAALASGTSGTSRGLYRSSSWPPARCASGSAVACG